MLRDRPASLFANLVRKRAVFLVVAIPLLVQMAAAAAAGAAVVTVIAWPWKKAPAPQTPPVPTGPLGGRVIAVDAGHGGFDGGVSGGGLVEKDVNLDLALRLKARIEVAGGTAVLTRDQDVAYAAENKDDFDHRLLLAEEGLAQVIVSLHANGFPDPGQFGAQTFFPPKVPEAQRMALLIQEELVRLHPDNYREALEEGTFYLMKNSKVPAVLVELGFLTNPGDRARLSDPAFKDRMADAIARGLERFFAGEQPGLAPVPPHSSDPTAPVHKRLARPPFHRVVRPGVP